MINCFLNTQYDQRYEKLYKKLFKGGQVGKKKLKKLAISYIDD